MDRGQLANLMTEGWLDKHVYFLGPVQIFGVVNPVGQLKQSLTPLKRYRSVLIGTRLLSLEAAFAGKAFWCEPGLAGQGAAPGPHWSAMVQSELASHNSFLLGPLNPFAVQLRVSTFMRLEILTFALDAEDHTGERGTVREMEVAVGQGCNQAVSWGCCSSLEPWQLSLL